MTLSDLQDLATRQQQQINAQQQLLASKVQHSQHTNANANPEATTKAAFRPNQVIQRKCRFSRSFGWGPFVLAVAFRAAAAAQKKLKLAQLFCHSRLHYTGAVSQVKKLSSSNWLHPLIEGGIEYITWRHIQSCFINCETHTTPQICSISPDDLFRGCLHGANFYIKR